MYMLFNTFANATTKKYPTRWNFSKRWNQSIWTSFPRARANYAEKAEVANSEEINILIERESVLGMGKARG